MSAHPTLFDLHSPPPEPERGRARHTDPDTAKQAGESVNATRLENIVLSFLTLMYPRGYTTKELERELRIDRVSISPRIKPLFDKGKVQKAGEKREGCEAWRAIR